MYICKVINNEKNKNYESINKKTSRRFKFKDEI